MANPIIQRELIGVLRTRRALAAQVALALALAALVVVRWPTGQAVSVELATRLDLRDRAQAGALADHLRRMQHKGEVPADRTVALRSTEGEVLVSRPLDPAALQAVTEAAQEHKIEIVAVRDVAMDSGGRAIQVLRVFGYGLLAAMVLLAPAFPAASIVRERQRGTLALLLNTPLGPWAILLGKLAGGVAFAGLLLVISLPAAAACYAMGGVDLFRQLLPLYAVLLLVGVQYATLALLVSGCAGTTESAMRITYGCVLALCVFTLGPYQVLQGLLPGAGMEAVQWLRCASPIPAVMHVLGQGDVGSGGVVTGTDPVGRFMVIAAVSSVLMLLVTRRRLHSRMLDRPRPTGRVTDEQSARVRAFRRFFFMWYFDPKRRSGLIPRGVNPVMMKEFRTRRFGRRHWMMRMIGLCLLASLGLMLAATRSTMDWGVPTLGGLMVLLQVALIVLFTPALAAGVISGERESGGWDLLRMTPLGAVSIVTGKLMSVMATLLLLLAATLPGYLILVLIDAGQATRVAHVLVTLLFTAAFAVLLSAAVSSVCRRTAVATVTAYLLLVGLIAGTLLVWLAADAPFTHGTVEAALQFNPLAAALSLIDAPGFTAYRLTPGNWWVMAAGCAVCLGVLVVQTARLTRAR
jgi:ABC-type transport system involved in multi-copper enzyme maturation permease subunit